MTTPRIVMFVGAGALAIGILAGSAGTIIARDTSSAGTVDCTSHMAQMQSMMSGSGSMMNGSGSMMNGSSGMMDGDEGASPGASFGPGGMMGHHATPTPAPTR